VGALENTHTHKHRHAPLRGFLSIHLYFFIQNKKIKKLHVFFKHTPLGGFRGEEAEATKKLVDLFLLFFFKHTAWWFPWGRSRGDAETGRTTLACRVCEFRV
jgi:hypothetical protein